ncbi:MAG: LysM peptidoglycan-binding domain-containing protein [Candidatus Micrarchaeota archaeon]|nr:LysM peptidoglycan-binding domain-containing protein [Candidatus Micrarchaeota archaeon]
MKRIGIAVAALAVTFGFHSCAPPTYHQKGAIDFEYRRRNAIDEYSAWSGTGSDKMLAEYRPETFNPDKARKPVYTNKANCAEYVNFTARRIIGPKAPLLGFYGNSWEMKDHIINGGGHVYTNSYVLNDPSVPKKLSVIALRWNSEFNYEAELNGANYTHVMLITSENPIIVTHSASDLHCETLSQALKRFPGAKIRYVFVPNQEMLNSVLDDNRSKHISGFYAVEQGDTFYGIVNKLYHGPPEERNEWMQRFIELNDIHNPDVIFANDVLYIPQTP